MSLRVVLSAAAAAVVLGAGFGCAASRLYVNPEADLSAYRKVAILPFGNLTGERFAGERVAREMMTELIRENHYRLVDPAEFWSALLSVGGEPGSDGVIKPEKLREAGAKVEAQGVIRGVVTEYLVQRQGAADVPAVGFDVELIDMPTMNVVWRTSVYESGRGRLPVLGGQGSRSLGVVTRKACARVIGRLRGRVL